MCGEICTDDIHQMDLRSGESQWIHLMFHDAFSAWLKIAVAAYRIEVDYQSLCWHVLIFFLSSGLGPVGFSHYSSWAFAGCLVWCLNCGPSGLCPLPLKTATNKQRIRYMGLNGSGGHEMSCMKIVASLLIREACSALKDVIDFPVDVRRRSCWHICFLLDTS